MILPILRPKTETSSNLQSEPISETLQPSQSSSLDLPPDQTQHPVSPIVYTKKKGSEGGGNPSLSDAKPRV